MSDKSKSNKISYDIEVEVGKSLENLEKVKKSLDSLNDLKFKQLGDEYNNTVNKALKETTTTAFDVASHLEKISRSMGLSSMADSLGKIQRQMKAVANEAKNQVKAAEEAGKATKSAVSAQDAALDKFRSQINSINIAIKNLSNHIDTIKGKSNSSFELDVNTKKAKDNIDLINTNIANIKKEMGELSGFGAVAEDLNKVRSSLAQIRPPKELSIKEQQDGIRALIADYKKLQAEKSKTESGDRKVNKSFNPTISSNQATKNAEKANDIVVKDGFTRETVKKIIDEYAKTIGLLDGIKNRWLEIASTLDTKVSASIVGVNLKTKAMSEMLKNLPQEINNSFKNIKIPELPKLDIKEQTTPKKVQKPTTKADEDLKDYTERLSTAWQDVSKAIPVSLVNAVTKDTRAMYEYLWNAAHIDYSAIREAFSTVNAARGTLDKFGKDVVAKAADRKAQEEAEKKESSNSKKVPDKPDVKTLDSQIRAKEDELRKAYASGKKTNDTKVDVSKQQNELVQLLKKGAEQDESLGKYARALTRITQAEALLQQLGNGDFAKGINRADRDARKYLTTLEELRRHFEELKRSVSAKLGEEPAKRLETAQKEHDKLVNSGWNSRDNGTILNERKWEQARQRIIALRKVLSELKGDLSTKNPFSEGKYADYVKNVQNQPMNLKDIEKARSDMKVTNLFDEYIKQKENAAKKYSSLLKSQMEEEQKAQKERENQAKEAAAKEAARQNKINEQLKALERVKRNIADHTGKDGLVYTHNSYLSEKHRIEDIAKALKDLGHATGGIDESLLKGVNRWDNVKKPEPIKANKEEALTISDSFNRRLSEARKNAQDLYLQLQQTHSTADKIGFEKARQELRLLNRQAERFNEEISKAPRHALNVENILRRARESANWAIGSSIENHIISFPSDVVSDVTRYELAMAGIAQVLPKVEKGQAAMNSEFSKFVSIGAQFGQSADNVLDAARSVGRLYGQGGGDADVGAKNTEILTAQAAKMATTDNFEMREAVLGLESALSQFNMQTEDSNLLLARSTHILDVWTKLAHTSGASAQDLTEGVKQSGAAANAAGVSFGFLNALIATGVRTTAKSGNEIGTMLKSLFASIQSDKAVKAMQKFGIEVYKIGANGKKELRPIEDLILDISKGLQHTNLDSKSLSDFMLAISGGKWQSSKVIALLSNYKELKRTIELTKDSAGFTDQQLALQMDTVARKVETLKANIAKLFMSNGNNGLLNDLKWVLNILNNLVKGLSSGESNAYKYAKGIIAVVAAYKLLPPLINKIARNAGRAAAAWRNGGSSINISNPIANIQAQYQASRNAALMSKMNPVMNTRKDVAALATVSSIRQTKQYATELNRANRINKQFKNSTELARRANLSFSRQMQIADRMAKLYKVDLTTARTRVIALGDAARMSAVGIGRASTAMKIFSAVLNGFGGPIGLVITALTLVGTYLLETSEEAGQAAAEYEAYREEQENLTATLKEQAEQWAENYGEVDESVQQAEKLATKYNELEDELEQLTAANDESAESIQRINEIKQEQGQISDQIAEILHTNSDQFLEDGKMNLSMIMNLSDEDRAKALQKIESAKAEIAAENEAKRALIESTKKRVTAMDAEGKSINHLALAYRALCAVVAGAVGVLGAEMSKLASVVDTPLGRALLPEDWIDNIKATRDKLLEYGRETLNDATDFNKDPREGYYNAAGEIAALENEIRENDDKTAELTKIEEHIANGTKSPKKEQVDPTRERNNEGKDSVDFGNHRGGSGAGAGSGSGNSSSGREKKEPKEYIKYDSEQQQVIATAKDMMSRGDFAKYGVKESSLFSLLNMLYGKDAKNINFSGISDLFMTGGSDPFDSLYKFLDRFGQLASAGDSEGEIWKKLYGNFLSDEQLDKVLPDYIEEFDKKYNSTKYSRDYSRNDKHRMTEGSRLNAGGYDYSSFTNPYLAKMAVETARGVQEQYGNYIPPNMIYGRWMVETPDVKEFTPDRFIGGIKMDYATEEKFLEAAINTFGRGTGYSSARTQSEFDDALLANQYIVPADDRFRATEAQYANESGWNTKAQTIGENIGEAMVKEADAHAGEQWRGIDAGFDDNSTWERQCSSWVSYMMNKHGITSVNSPDGDTLMKQAGSAYHAGEAPLNAGDIINWRSHVGIYDGNGGYIARNSSGGVHHGTMEEAQQYFGAVLGRVDIKELAQANGVKYGSPSISSSKISSSETVDRWEKYRSKDVFHRNGIEEAAYRYETDQKRYEEAHKRLESEAKLSGYTAEIYKKIAENEEAKLKSTKDTLSYWEQVHDSSMVFFKDYSERYKGFKSFLDEQHISLEGLNTLPSSELNDIAKKFDKNGKGEFTRAINTLTKSREQLTNLESKYAEEKAEHDMKVYGTMTPTDRIDAQLENLSNAHEHTVSGMTDNESYIDNMKYYEQRLELLQKKYQWIHEQLSKDESADYKKRSGWEQERDEQQKRLDALIEHRKTLKEEDKTLNAEIQKISDNVDQLTNRIDQNREHGSEAAQQHKKDLAEVQKAIDETKKSLNAVTDQLADIIENGVHSMFSDVLLEGKSFKDSWKSLWSDIAKLALQQILKVQMQKWGLKDILSGENITRRVQRRNFVNNVGGLGGFVSGWSGSVLDKIPSSRYRATNQFGGKVDYTKAFSDLGQKLAINSATVKGASAVTNAMSNATGLLTQQAITNTAKQVAGAASTAANTSASATNTGALAANTAATTALNGALGAKTFFQMATGGLIPKFATGGYTTGLIRGAGTGTSDSILTYLANRGQFIRTSNGEYIIKKSTVDKVGVSFLDTLNANPEAIAGMKRYADGGDLGESYEPVMSPKTVENYRKFSHNSTVIKTSSNKKLEQLMQQQNDMLAAIGSKDNGSGNMVVLNTQADSASVMRAIQKNPRAFQRIMGNQQRHGFR